MSTLTTKLSLKRPDTTDPFLTSDFQGNYDKLDAKPGIHICTSSTRPSWVSGNAGMLIWETDTSLLWSWSGTAWARVHGKGLLGSSTANGAFSSTHIYPTMDLASSSAAVSVTIPAGGRPILVRGYAHVIRGNTDGWSIVGLFRTNSGTPAATATGGTTVGRDWQFRCNDGPDSNDPSYTTSGGNFGSNPSVEISWIDTAATGTVSYGIYLAGRSSGHTATIGGGTPSGANLVMISATEL